MDKKTSETPSYHFDEIPPDYMHVHLTVWKRTDAILLDGRVLM